MIMADTATITMFRYDPTVDQAPAYATYDVPMPDTGEVMNVLKALHYINKNLEPISYDYTCRCNFCGRCGMVINGAPQLACNTRVEAGQTYTLDPLPGFPIVKDLVIDTTRTLKKFSETKMTVKTQTGLHRPLPQEAGLWWGDMKNLNMCRECMLCYVACPVLQEEGKWESFYGPGALMQIVMRYLDSEDEDDRLREATYAGVFDCTLCGACNAVCSAQIDIVKLMQRLQDDATQAGLQPQGDPTPAWPII